MTQATEYDFRAMQMMVLIVVQALRSTNPAFRSRFDSDVSKMATTPYAFPSPEPVVSDHMAAEFSAAWTELAGIVMLQKPPQ